MDSTTHHVLPLLRQATPVQQALSPSSSTTRTKQETFPSPHKNSTDQPTRNKSSRAREREDPYTRSLHATEARQTHLDGRGQGGAQTTRRARNHGCRGLLLRVSGGGWVCMGGAENRNVEETNKKLVGSLRVPWCANWERDHGLRSLCAAFSTLSSWPGRSLAVGLSCVW